MSLPYDDNGTSVGGSHCKSFTDLQLQSSQASGSTQAGYAFTTIVPATCIVLGTLASGQAQLVLRTSTSSSMSVVGNAASATIPPSGSNWATVDTDIVNTFVQLLTVDSGWSCAFTKLSLLVLYKMTAGENFTDCRKMFIAVSSTVRGDGSGTFTLTNQ